MPRLYRSRQEFPSCSAVFVVVLLTASVSTDAVDPDDPVRASSRTVSAPWEVLGSERREFRSRAHFHLMAGSGAPAQRIDARRRFGHEPPQTRSGSGEAGHHQPTTELNPGRPFGVGFEERKLSQPARSAEQDQGSQGFGRGRQSGTRR